MCIKVYMCKVFAMAGWEEVGQYSSLMRFCLFLQELAEHGLAAGNVRTPGTAARMGIDTPSKFLNPQKTYNPNFDLNVSYLTWLKHLNIFYWACHLMQSDYVKIFERHENLIKSCWVSFGICKQNFLFCRSFAFIFVFVLNKYESHVQVKENTAPDQHFYLQAYVKTSNRFKN